MTELKIRIKKSFADVTPAVGETPEIIDWTPALVACATEVEALNQLVNGTTFPRPVKCNPDATQPEGYLGDVNTPPDSEGFVTVRLADYDYFDLGFLPVGVVPQTFSFVYGYVGGGII
jgi:hypothetical protein